MRIVVLGSAVQGVESVSGEYWSTVHAMYPAGVPNVPRHQPDLVDYDVFILDPQEGDFRGSDRKRVDDQIVDRVHAGGCAIVFCTGTSLSWLPGNLGARARAGTRLDIADHEPQSLKELFIRHSGNLFFHVQFAQFGGWTVAARSADAFPVALFMSYNLGAFVLLPDSRQRPALVRDFLDRVLPRIAPKLFSGTSQPNDPSPVWADQFVVPGTEDLDRQIETLRLNRKALEDEYDSLERKRLELDRYRGLLWLEGIPLETEVARALNLLGIEAEKQEPIDLVVSIADGRQLYIEVEASSGSTRLRKGRQLLQYVAEAEDPSLIEGAIVANPLRLLPPADRGDQDRPLFAIELERLAKKNGWALVTTVEIYDLVVRFLSGDKQAPLDARAKLGLNSLGS